MRATRPSLLVTAVVTVLAGALGLGACGVAPPRGQSVPAGHASPAGAAVGFLLAASANDEARACDYVVPAQKATCTQAFAARSSVLSVKNLRIGATTVSGPRALATALGSLCTNRGSKVCFESTDSKGGQPADASGFDDAYTMVESGASPKNDPAIPCMMVGDLWYVDLGQTSPAVSPPGTKPAP